MRAASSCSPLAAFACLLALCTAGEPRVREARTRVASEAEGFVRSRLARLREFVPHVSVEHGLQGADVERFHSRILEAKAALAVGDLAKAYSAATDSWLDYFVREVLVAENRLCRRVLVAGPFPAGGCPELERDILARELDDTPYAGAGGRSAGWRHVEFGTFIGSPDHVPLETTFPAGSPATVYVTTFLYADFPKTREPPGFEEGELTLRLAGAPIEKAWVWGTEVHAGSSASRHETSAPVEITVRRPGGWWWLLFRLRANADTRYVELEYLDEAGTPLGPERAGDYHGFTGIYAGEKLARLALWAPHTFGNTREKLAQVRAWFERVERTVLDYVKQHGELPETNSGFDAAAARRWDEFLAARFPGRKTPLLLRNPFTDAAQTGRFGATYFDYRLHSGGKWFRTKSLRIVVNGPLPLDTWAAYDPANGLWSPGQIFLTLHKPDINGFSGRRATNWVSWAANYLFTARGDEAKRRKLRQGARLSTYERLPARP